MLSNQFIAHLNQQKNHFTHFVNRDLAIEFIEYLYLILFGSPEFFENEKAYYYAFEKLRDKGMNMLCNTYKSEQADYKEIMDTFIDSIAPIYEQLEADAQAILDFDPAVKNMEEIYTAYPGFYATTVYRFAHQLALQNVPLLPRILTEYAHSKTGIDIHPNAVIGNRFFIDHGTGIVIGETCIIGDNVKIYQGVTLGAMHVSKDLAQQKRHPTIEDNVIIYANATILGGDTVVGHDAVIAGNVWLTTSVEPYSVVYQKHDTIVRSKHPLPEPINFVI